MRHILLAGASALALVVATAGGARAGAVAYPTTTFTNPYFFGSGSVQTYTVGQTGVYKIVADGASGGNVGSGIGGLGAAVGGDVTLIAGTVLDIVAGSVGGAGYLYRSGRSLAAGGGGGTFVYTSGGTLLFAAGGGGGAGGKSYGASANFNSTAGGSTIQSPLASNEGYAGGTNGSGGGALTGRAVRSYEPLGGAGAGWNYHGGGKFRAVAPGTNYGGQGSSRAGKFYGGSGPTRVTNTGSATGYGGFGGGGAGGLIESAGAAFAAGGGGGGYSGGAAGRSNLLGQATNYGGTGYQTNAGGGGGGGGSFIYAGATNTLAAAANTSGYSGNGYAKITAVSLATAAVPEPGTLGLIGSALLALGLVRRRRMG